jgi:hypothetical protein
VVAPGSRRIAGGFYSFAEECRPDEQAVADVPDFLLEEILKVRDKDAIPGLKATPISTGPTASEGLPASGILRPDAVIRVALRRDAVAGPLYRGQLQFLYDLSRNDMALADKITFYSSHNFEQALRLFVGSGLYRYKFLRPVNVDWNYAAWTLRKTFRQNPNNWIPTPRRSRATGAPKGRKPSDSTLAVVLLHRQHPAWKPTRIAAELGKPAGTVRRILHGLRRGRYSDLER